MMTTIIIRLRHHRAITVHCQPTAMRHRYRLPVMVHLRAITMCLHRLHLAMHLLRRLHPWNMDDGNQMIKMPLTGHFSYAKWCKSAGAQNGTCKI